MYMSKWNSGQKWLRPILTCQLSAQHKIRVWKNWGKKMSWRELPVVMMNLSYCGQTWLSCLCFFSIFWIETIQNPPTCSTQDFERSYKKKVLSLAHSLLVCLPSLPMKKCPLKYENEEMLQWTLGCLLWRPFLDKILIIKLLHKSVSLVTVVPFRGLLCIFIGNPKNSIFQCVPYYLKSERSY